MKLPPSKEYRLAKRVGGASYTLTDAELDLHVAVLGGTGFGKSRLLNKLIRDHIDQGVGIAVIEPGDLCDDVMAYYARKVVERATDAVLNRIHCLRASPWRCFRYDIAKMQLHRPVHPD